MIGTQCHYSHGPASPSTVAHGEQSTATQTWSSDLACSQHSSLRPLSSIQLTTLSNCCTTLRYLPLLTLSHTPTSHHPTLSLPFPLQPPPNSHTLPPHGFTPPHPLTTTLPTPHPQSIKYTHDIPVRLTTDSKVPRPMSSSVEGKPWSRRHCCHCWTWHCWTQGDEC